VFALIALAPTFLLFSGCKTTESGDTLFVFIERNNSQATWSSEYISEHGTKEQTYIVNRYDFESWIDNLPTAEDMKAPAGKVFAGWYFDKNCSDGNFYNLHNWEKYAIKNGKPTRLNAYAKWIDEDYVNVVFDLDNDEAKYVDTSKIETEKLVARSELENIMDYLPTADDASLNHSTLSDWSLISSYGKVSKYSATVEKIEKALESQNYVSLYAMWDYDDNLIELRFEVIAPSGTSAAIKTAHYLQHKTDWQHYYHPYAHRIITQGSKDKMLTCCVFSDDSMDFIKSLAPNMEDISVTNSKGKDVSSKYKITSYKIGYLNVVYDWTEEDFISSRATNQYSVPDTFVIYLVLG
jgi:hypothetical protein